MSFNSYLIRKFDFTHENIYFKKFSENLKSIYNEKPGEHILIGNISCNGHQFDAIYISRGQISVIDFKDYHGELTFSENNPWKMKNSEGELLFVQGGAQMRNPYQQVKAYRFSLMEYLSSRSNSIIGKRTNIKWDHIGCIVLFQDKVIFNDEEIPKKVKRYFHISDKDRINNLLDSIYSQSLEFSDNEINLIVSTLDVKPENLIGRVDIEAENPTKLDQCENRLALIKRLMSGSASDSLPKRIINYYKTLINAERYKESKSNKTYSYIRNPEIDFNNYPLDLSDSQNFHNEFLRNFESKFPNNLFVALNISVDNNIYPLLNTIILSADIKNKDIVYLNFNEFELHNKTMESMGLSEDLIDEFTTSINMASTLEEKLNCIRTKLGVEVELSNNFSVGLSNESLFSVQLVSELNSLSKISESNFINQIFESFIYNSSILKNNSNLKMDPNIQVTPLNPSQKKAVNLSFEQPLTVITGPPGTGKSQVVINILANAVLNGHSVLFASKNNKAIDSVKERMNVILKEPYLLRMGSRDEIKDNLKPQLTNFISRKNSNVYNDNITELDNSINDIREKNSTLELLNSQILRIPELEIEIKNLESELNKVSNAFYKWLDEKDSEFKKLFFDNNTSFNIDLNEAALLIKKIQKWESGFISKLLFKWFHQSKFERTIQNINKELSPEVYEYVQLNAPWADTKSELLDSTRINLEFLINLKKNIEKLKNYKKDLENIEYEIIKLKEEYDNLLISEPSIKAEIVQIELTLPQLGQNALNKSVFQKLFKLDPLNTQTYIDYLPVTIWRNEDISDLRNCTTKFVSNFNAICLTSLSVKNSFLLDENIFDLLVIDEASQCDIASVLPMIFRSKNVVIIGDPLQLKHITKVQDYEEKFLIEGLKLEKQQLNYVNKSLFDFSFSLANKSSFESVFLDEHYRCHPEIIEFSNANFYERRLGQSMKIMTSEIDFHFGATGINWINVVGGMHEYKNFNIAEVNKCVDLVKSLATQFPDASIGIITPFVDQHKAISERLSVDLKMKIKPDTVHRYQGDEKDIIIFTTVVTENSPSSKANFINDKDYLLNVALTRAKSSLYIIGNFNYCRNLRNDNLRTPLSNLADYVDSLNKVEI